MKIIQLIKLLQKQDPNRIVLVSSDSEGNCLHAFENFSLGSRRKDGYEYDAWGEDEVNPDGEGKPAFIMFP